MAVKLISFVLGLIIVKEIGLEIYNPNQVSPVRLRQKQHLTTPKNERINSYRFSMANLEETQEAELDAILGELSILEQKCDMGYGRGHSRSNSTISGATNSTIMTLSSSITTSSNDSTPADLREPRTESPDNDSAFSDTVSLLSSESSTSSGVSSMNIINKSLNVPQFILNLFNLIFKDAKTAKIQLALQKLEHASVRRLFVKAFSIDGASKSLLVDERMTCGYVTRLLADKNHVPMEPNWSLIEHLPDLQMERLFEDHELLVENLLMWSNDSKNRVLFHRKTDKTLLFNKPELFLPGTQMAPGSEHDEHTRSMLLEEFFTTGSQVALEGPLYLKSDSKKGWKRYHFVLRASGLYYYPKEKTRSSKDLLCLALFTGHNVYKGLSWKKKHKSPSDYTFALKCPKTNNAGGKGLKMLCTEDADTLEKWITAIRVAKYGKKLLDNHKNLLEDLAREDLDKLASTRSGSIGSMLSSVVPPFSVNTNGTMTNGTSNNSIFNSSGRLSRASSSSSSGCLSDDNGFDSEFTTGTIKRKPSMKPNLPLTSKTRQLKEVGETSRPDSNITASPERGGTLTRRHSRRRSEESNGSGTLKRRQQTANRGSMESMISSTSSTPTPSAPGTPLGHPQPLFTINDHSNLKISSPTTPPSPLEALPSCMTDSMMSLPPPPPPLDELTNSMQMSQSTLSLDSLPPPPPPCDLDLVDHCNFNGSQMSLISLPPPPADMKPVFISQQMSTPTSPCINETVLLQSATTPPSPAPPSPTKMQNHFNYCSKTLPAPEHMQKEPQMIYAKTMKPALKAPPYKAPPSYNGLPNHPPLTQQKSVTFADSPVLLRKKVCFEDQIVQQLPLSPRRVSRDSLAAPPPPPPRAEATRLSITSNSSLLGSPKRLSDSTSNPPQDFWKDLQRVVKKKWQVAQKCKLEPTTTPHEVLGFRDLIANGTESHYYRETSNVSNWVQEHYGCDSMYENLGVTSTIVEPNYPITQQSPVIKKRPPPPPPKRSDSTHLSRTGDNQTSLYSN
ncbi:unnamed protein product [Diamesa serratosioi]